jgi:hypothetical protein
MKTLAKKIMMMSAIGVVCAGFQSCEADEENAPEPIAAFSVSVDFGEGEETWTANSASWIDYRIEYNEVNFQFKSDKQFPLVMGSITPSGETAFPQSWDDNEYLFFEYYSLNWAKIGDALWDRQLNIPYGDWQVDAGTVNITSLTDSHLSGTANLVMYNLVEYAIEMNDNPNVKSLTVTFNNVPLNIATRSGAINGAIESSDKSFSFSRDKARLREALAR